jgi:tetratricopeptide (TPR) repeat protein
MFGNGAAVSPGPVGIGASARLTSPVPKASRGKELSVGRDALAFVALIGLTWAVFGQTLRHDFVNFDDHAYVYETPEVTNGLTLQGVAWAFTHDHARNWHPLTTISHMLDCQLFGLNAGGHHFTNVLLHTIAVVLLFLLLRQLTGTFWRSAFVAAVFAVHPLRVESVAWIAERKDLLSAIFFMLTLAAYVRYARRPSIGRYLTMSILFALGLMSKPMLVTVPFVLLLLDYWPLARSQKSEVRGQKTRSWLQLIAEKVPLLVLSAVSCAITFFVQKRGPLQIDQLPFIWRLKNAIVSYVAYLWQMLWPSKLAVFYPHPNNSLLSWQIILALCLLVGISAIVLALRQGRPYLLTGWLWYLGMLVPVVGIVQVGEQARADRYTYLPQIGLYLALTWLIVDLAKTWRVGRELLAICASTLVLLLSWLASVQASYWKSSETLWDHALAVTSDNDVAHNNLGFLLLRRGQLDNAISHFESALKIRTGNAERHYNLGLALIHNNLANALLWKGRITDAIPHYEEAVTLRPDYADAHYNFGFALMQFDRVDDAIAQWQKTVSLQPNDIEAHITLGQALDRVGRTENAMVEYEAALQLAQARGTLPLAEQLRAKIDMYYRTKSPGR